MDRHTPYEKVERGGSSHTHLIEDYRERLWKDAGARTLDDTIAKNYRAADRCTVQV